MRLFIQRDTTPSGSFADRIKRSGRGAFFVPRETGITGKNLNEKPEEKLESKPEENQEKTSTTRERHAFNQPDRRGRPSRKTASRGEIDDLLMSWRSGGEAGKRAAQILLEKYKIRAILPAAPGEKE